VAFLGSTPRTVSVREGKHARGLTIQPSQGKIGGETRHLTVFGRYAVSSAAGSGLIYNEMF
jgi:hypothetical protein